MSPAPPEQRAGAYLERLAMDRPVGADERERAARAALQPEP
jgi:hypothetical protein